MKDFSRSVNWCQDEFGGLLLLYLSVKRYFNFEGFDDLGVLKIWVGVAINPRPAGTRPAPSQKKPAPPAPSRPIYIIKYRVGFLKLKRVFKIETSFKRVEKPESDPNGQHHTKSETQNMGFDHGSFL